MGIWAKLLGKDEIINKGMELIDEAFDTDQERGERKIRLLDAYAIYKVAQRYLMLISCPPYVLAWFITFVASFFVTVDYQIELLQGIMGYIVLTIVTFYFGGGAAEGIITRFKNKKD